MAIAKAISSEYLKGLNTILPLNRKISITNYSYILDIVDSHIDKSIMSNLDKKILRLYFNTSKTKTLMTTSSIAFKTSKSNSYIKSLVVRFINSNLDSINNEIDNYITVKDIEEDEIEEAVIIEKTNIESSNVAVDKWKDYKRKSNVQSNTAGIKEEENKSKGAQERERILKINKERIKQEKETKKKKRIIHLGADDLGLSVNSFEILKFFLLQADSPNLICINIRDFLARHNCSTFMEAWKANKLVGPLILQPMIEELDEWYRQYR